jgi:hypothetical protein
MHSLFTKRRVLNVRTIRQRVWLLCSVVFRFHSGACHSEHISRIDSGSSRRTKVLCPSLSPPGIFTYIYFYSRYRLLRHVFTETWSPKRLVWSPALSYWYWFRTRGVDASKMECVVVYSAGWKLPRVSNKGGLAQIELFIV